MNPRIRAVEPRLRQRHKEAGGERGRRRKDGEGGEEGAAKVLKTDPPPRGEEKHIKIVTTVYIPFMFPL